MFKNFYFKFCSLMFFVKIFLHWNGDSEIMYPVYDEEVEGI